MDFTNIKDWLSTFFSLLTKLMVGLGVLKADEDAPYQKYVDDLKDIADAVKNAVE